MIIMISMNNKKEAIVFIDAGYLSLISKSLGKGMHLRFDIGKFSEHIANRENMRLSKTFYYTAPPYQSSNPGKDETKRKANYDKFVNKLRKISNFIVREGRCQKIDNIFMQKGVDTLLTMDLFEVVHKKEVETVILLACDTDFVPILNRIREEGIKVILYYFSDFNRKSKFFMSNHILTACDKKILLRKEDFDRFPVD